MAGRLGRRARLRGVQPRAGGGRVPADVRAGDAAVPVRRTAHGARQELHDGRRRHARPPSQRLACDASDGVRRVRPAGRERCDQERPAPGRLHPGEHRGDPQADEADGLVDRLDARGLDVRARVLQVDAVDLPAAVRGRAGLSPGGAGQVVPRRPDGAGQRAGDRRPLRAVRQPGRGEEPRAVVLQDHGLRPAAAGRPADRELAGAGRHHAAQLDRPQRGSRGRLPGRARPVGRAAGVHHAAGHAVRGDVLRAGARASAGDRAGPRHRARGGRRRLRAPARPPCPRSSGPRRSRSPASSPAAAWSIPSTARRSPSGSPTTC